MGRREKLKLIPLLSTMVSSPQPTAMVSCLPPTLMVLPLLSPTTTMFQPTQHLQQTCASLLCWSLQCCSCRGCHSSGTDSPLQRWSLLQQRGCPSFLLSFSG